MGDFWKLMLLVAIASIAVATISYSFMTFAINRLYAQAVYKAIYDAVSERVDALVNRRTESLKNSGEKNN